MGPLRLATTLIGSAPELMNLRDGKPAGLATVAAARELSGFIWAAATA